MIRNVLVVCLVIILVCAAGFAQKIDPLSALPLAFEANQGQAPSGYSFHVRQGAVDALFNERGLDIQLSSGKRVSIGFSGAAPSDVKGYERMPGTANYLRGEDASKWITHVPTYAGIQYSSLYAGIDLRFYGNHSQLEHDFVVAPRANAEAIQLTIKGADEVRLSKAGDLEIVVDQSVLRFHRPVAYQELASGRAEVAAGFRLSKDSRVSFDVGAYDHDHELVIDPVLGFSTYLTGTVGSTVQAVTTDATGNIYVAGQTRSTDFPTAGPIQANCSIDSFFGTCTDAFVAKLDPTGHTLLYSTYLGGIRDENVGGIGVDANGNAVVTGTSVSQDFPVVSFTSYACGINWNCVFVSSLKPDGSGFNYSGFIAQSSFDSSQTVLALDAAGNAYVSGMTSDSGFPITPGTYGSSVTISNANDYTFISKISPAGSIVYSTVIPGTATLTFGSTNNVFRPGGIAVDSSGNPILTGSAGRGLPTTAGVISATYSGNQVVMSSTAAFVLKLNASATDLIYGTYIPGAEVSNGIALDGTGNAYIAGRTLQTTLATSANALQKNYVGDLSNCGWCSNGYIAEVSSDAKTLLAATYLAGTPSNAGTALNGIALDGSGNVAVYGATDAQDFPLKNPIQSKLNHVYSTTGSALAILTSDLSSEIFGTFLSGSSESTFRGLAISPTGAPIVVGSTLDFDFPTTPGSYQPQAPPSGTTQSIYNKGFVAKLDLATAAPAICSDSYSLAYGVVPVGSTATKTIGITNCGNSVLQINSLSIASAVISAHHNCSSVAPGGSCSVDVSYTPTDTSSVFDTLTIANNTNLPMSVAITGAGGMPALDFLPSTINFGDRFVNATGSPTSVFFYNNGNAPLLITSFSLTGDFTLAYNNCQQPVAQGDFCTIGITFVATAAGTRNGLLSIVDNAAQGSQTVALTGNGIVTYPAPTITSVTGTRMSTSGVPVAVRGTNFFPASVVSWNGSPRVTNYVTSTLINFILTPDDLSTAYEGEVTVSNPAPGGGTSAAVKIPIYGALLGLSLRHAVNDPVTGVLYATTTANTVIAVDPNTMSIVHEYAVGNSPNQIAISDDGSVLYVGLDATAQVLQMSVPSGTVTSTIDLSSAVGSAVPVVANSLAVAPGSPNTWAVNWCSVAFTPCGLGIAIFDGATRRPTTYETTQLNADIMMFFDSSTLLATTTTIGPSESWKFSVDPSGVRFQLVAQNFGGASPGGGYLQNDGTNVYVSNGQVLDPTTLGIVRTIPVLNGVAQRLEKSQSRIFYLSSQSSTVLLSSYNPSTSLLNSSTTLGESGGFGALNLSRFGTDGLMLALQSRILFVHSSIAQVQVNTPQITSVNPSVIVAGSPDTTITITGTNFDPAATVKWSGTAVGSTFVSSSQMTAVVPSALLATAGSATLTVTNPDATAGSAGVQVINAPTLTSITPATINAGQGSTIVTIKGTNFTSSAVVKWNSTVLSLYSFSTTQLEVLVPSNLLTVGTATVSVTVAGAPTVSGTVNVLGAGNLSQSATSLDFGTMNVGVSSAGKSVTLVNSGTAVVGISAITVSGDFAQTNTCGTQLAVNASCQITVVFTPTVAGGRAGTLLVLNDASSGTRQVDLLGNASDFSVSGSSNGSTPTQTVKSGSPASFTLAAQAAGGFTGTLTFTCSNAPTNGSCAVNPSTVQAGPTATNVTVTVATSTTTTTAQLRRNVALLAFACMTPLFFFQTSRKKLARSGLLLLLAFAIGIVSLASCGGGGGSSAPPPVHTQTVFTPAGTYNVVVTATSGSLSKQVTLQVVVQ